MDVPRTVRVWRVTQRPGDGVEGGLTWLLSLDVGVGEAGGLEGPSRLWQDRAMG